MMTWLHEPAAVNSATVTAVGTGMHLLTASASAPSLAGVELVSDCVSDASSNLVKQTYSNSLAAA